MAPDPASAARGVRWSSIVTVLGALLVVAVSVFSLLRGRTWAWIPLVLAGAVALREIRYLQRTDQRRDAPR
ncbi:hypothetical protein [Oerskovia flava]|uniref:hypothetical protein n=1 Tax=Oerskovia flava TaxID=2986422 RepID=UPI0022404617|nr:hypothetical protein [Oerskovia sp. JB1-3-2]